MAQSNGAAPPQDETKSDPPGSSSSEDGMPSEAATAHLPDETEDTLHRLQAVLRELQKTADELKLDEQSLETVLSNALDDFATELSRLLERAEESVEDMGGQLNAPIQAVLRALEDDLQETATYLEKQADEMTQEGLKRYEQIAVVKGELKSVARELEEIVDTYRDSTEDIANLRHRFKEEVDRAQATASILEGAALDKDIDKLNDTFENHITEVVKVGHDIQEKTQKMLESHFNDMCNRLDERRHNLDSRAKSTRKMLDEKHGEMKAIHAAVEETEERVNEEIANLVAQTKAITARRALLILAMSFCGTTAAIMLGHSLGLI